MRQKILLVDDEKDIVEFLEYNLVQEGFNVITAYEGETALQKLAENPDLIILDIMMPKMNGYDVCTRIRETKGFEHTPVIFLTAKSSEVDEIKGLNLGADDFIRKPVSPNKIVARVKSNLRKMERMHVSGQRQAEIEVGPIKINMDRFTVHVDGDPVVFPKKEFEILSFLASQPGKVFPRERILSEIWGDDVFVVERTIDVHVRKIREKLNKNSYMIETVKGVGYRFKNIE